MRYRFAVSLSDASLPMQPPEDQTPDEADAPPADASREAEAPQRVPGAPAEGGPPSAPARSTGTLGSAALVHAVAFILFAVGALASLWFWSTNRNLLEVFAALGGPFQLGGGGFEFVALAWTIFAIAIFTTLGWFFLSCLEIYIPRSPALALALIIGLGLAGFAYELLAMAGLFFRPPAMALPAFMILAIWPFAVWAGRRPPQTGAGGEPGLNEQAVRRRLAEEAFRTSLVAPGSMPSRLFRFTSIGLIGLITALIFYHAMFFPEAYWDSLILYQGYARMMFHEHGVVQKVVGQVGIGLGANYPHLFAYLGTAVSLVVGEWSELPQRTIAPLAGLASTVLVYHTALRATRHVNFSLAATLLYRSLPFAIAYDQYGSDYALAILFAAAFVYVSLLYIQTALTGYFVIMTLLIALAMHLNYLMGILWLPWALTLFCAHVARGGLPARSSNPEAEPPTEYDASDEPDWTVLRDRPGLISFITSPPFVITLAACVAVGATWHVRNWIVTGNPVYAFYYEIFGGINITPAVMESAALEWGSNGAGIGVWGEDVATRLLSSWSFFMGPYATKSGPAMWQAAYRLQPFFPGFVVAGSILLVARVLSRGLLRRGGPKPDDVGRFGFVMLVLAAALFAFHYALAPFYLYQIIPILPVLAAISIFAFPFWRPAPWRYVFGALVLLIGVVPGVAMATMGFKVFSVELGPGRVESPTKLFVFHHPLPEREQFYRWKFGREAEMWSYMNENLKGEQLLTHENRHLVLDPSIKLIHLDDWAMQILWDYEPADRVKELKKLGVRYYLRVPMELRHPINERMGTAQWLDMGLMRPVFEAGGSVLYEFN